jgi:hypothetical protein
MQLCDLPIELLLLVSGHVGPQDMPSWRLACRRALHAAHSSQHSVRWTLAFGDEQLAARVLASCVLHARVCDLRVDSGGCNGAAAVQTLAPALESLRGLRTLCLSNNYIGSVGAAALAPHLGALTGLCTLHLANNNLGSVGIAALAPALGALTGLCTLHLGYNNLGDVGSNALARALGPLTGLHSLYLPGNHIDDAGVAALAPVLGGLTLMTLLDLHGNDLTSESVPVLSALQALPALEVLDVWNNLISDEGAEALFRGRFMTDLERILFSDWLS